MVRVGLLILWIISLGILSGCIVNKLALAQPSPNTSNIVTVVKTGDRNLQQQPFTFVGQGSINAAGDISFIGSNPMMSGIYVQKSPLLEGAPLREIVTSQDSSPFGGRFGNFTAPKINDNGEIAFSSVLNMASRVGGIFLARNGQITPVALVGDASPAGGIFDTNLATNLIVSLNNRGEVAFFAGLRETSTRAGIFIAQNGQLRKLITDLEMLPTGERAAFVVDTLPVLNNNGEVLIAVDLLAAEGSRRRALMLFNNGNWQTIIKTGDLAPDGSAFESIQGRGRLLNDQQTVAFLGRVNGRLAIYLAQPAAMNGWEVRRLVGVGDPAPDGGVFTDLNLALGPTNSGLNNRQDLVFRATTSQTLDGLFVSVNGELRRILGKRDSSNLGGMVPVDAALIGAFLGPMIADNATVVFEAILQGGISNKGLFLWLPTAVPLPQVLSARYQNNQLQLRVANLGTNIAVEINGQLPDARVRRRNETRITLSGSRDKLGLNRGANTNRVVLITNGLRSATVTF
jgi:hypothetical protein